MLASAGVSSSALSSQALGPSIRSSSSRPPGLSPSLLPPHACLRHKFALPPITVRLLTPFSRLAPIQAHLFDLFFFGVADPCPSALCFHVSSAFCVTFVSLGFGQSQSSLAIYAALPASCLRFSCASLLGFSSIHEVSGCPLLPPLSRPRRSHSSPSLSLFRRLCGCPYPPSRRRFSGCGAPLDPRAHNTGRILPSPSRASPASLVLSAPVLNFDEDGKPLTFKSAIAGPHREQWIVGDDTELIKLVETTRTLTPVHT